MVANGGNTEGLFRGAFMESGAVIPTGDISLGQPDYDALVQETGCAGTQDTLECLRQAPFPALQAAMNNSLGYLSYRVCPDFFDPLSSIMNCVPQSLNFVWGPKTDGTFLKAPLQHQISQGSVASVPFVTGNKTIDFRFSVVVNLATPGNCDDEGTAFSLGSVNVT
jgi:acetylcholinesterase